MQYSFASQKSETSSSRYSSLIYTILCVSDAWQAVKEGHLQQVGELGVPEGHMALPLHQAVDDQPQRGQRLVDAQCLLQPLPAALRGLLAFTACNTPAGCALPPLPLALPSLFPYKPSMFAPSKEVYQSAGSAGMLSPPFREAARG